MLMRLFLVLLFSLCLALPAAAGEPVKISINGSLLATDVDPVIVEGRTMVPIRAIAEGFGADVAWNGQKKQVTIEKSGNVVILVVNDVNALVDDAQVQMDVTPQIVNGRTMIPARFVSSALGAQVDWDGINRVVLIEKHEVDGGLTPEQVLEKSMVATDVYESYRFKGNIQLNMDMDSVIPLGQDSMQMQMNMEGACKKPATVYMKMDAVMPQMPGESLKMEMWTDGSTFYMNDGSGWEEVGSLSLPGQQGNPLLSNQPDPASAMKMIKECGGIVSFTRNDEDYYRVRIIFNAEKLFEYVLSQAGFPGLAPGMTAEDLKEMSEFFKSMKIKLMYDLKIHRGDFITESIQINGDMKMDMSSLAGVDTRMKVEMSGVINLYDYGKVSAITKPNV